MTPKRPSIFISSTIHDFKDLRSALRFYLESLGFDVYLSDFNDFPKPLDANTYEATLETLRSADFYILLVGSRVGGMYSDQDQISITRMEYRTAYEEAQKKKLRLLLLVREEVWNIRQDRKALREYLESAYKISRELSDEDVTKIVGYPSTFINDAQLIFNFLDEISKNEEMQKAISGQGEFPKANWIHPFSNFQDIIDALRNQLGIRTNLSTIALKVNLRRELLENLVYLVSKFQEKISPNYIYTSFAKKQIYKDGKGITRMPGRYLRWMIMHCTGTGKGANLSTRFIDQALQTGDFLVFNKHIAQYQESLLSQRLSQLREQIARLHFFSGGARDVFVGFISKYADFLKQENEIDIPNQDLLFPLMLADVEENTVRLTISILRALDGNEAYLQNLQLNQITPFADENEEIQKERPSLDELAEWVKSDQVF
ncbi:MAG: DUF4062 domain-containing protein [Chloroflexi bacterium]|nr:DUF4062 domain-containing protein [Chloroflexota bacterium]